MPRMRHKPEEIVAKLPPCVIPGTCRWYRENGTEVCLRCPQIVTKVSSENNQMVSVALPD
jgi:hypothetical protein